MDEMPKMRGDDIAERLLAFAARVIRMTDSLPRSYAGKHIATQVVRSGTSAGANYEEARGAESRNDFAHKLGVALKEVRESRYWLRVIVVSGMCSAERMNELIQEADELCRILGRSIITTRNAQTRKRKEHADE